MSIQAADAPYVTYLYNHSGELRVSPHAYLPDQVLSLASTQAGELKSPSDIFAAPDGWLYIADTENNRVVVLKEDYTLDKVLDTVVDTTGVSQTLNKPEGVYVTREGKLYIADTGNGRILILDKEYVCQKIITAPQAAILSEDFSFQPSAVAADDFGRVYVVSKGVNMGIMTMSEEGDFDGFLGAQKVVPNFFDLFWRNFMTEEQLKRIPQFVPTEYNNISMDEDGFAYVTTNTIDLWLQYSSLISKSTASDYAPVKKLNPAGNDVLRRTGIYPPAGDLDISNDAGPSSIIDVALGPDGVYTLLDSRQGRFFTYDADGNLLFAFGQTGYKEGNQQQPVSITYNGTKFVCLDKASGNITVYKRTDYGAQIHNALSLYRDRHYTQASQAWANLLTYNNNLDISYANLGKISYQQEKYAEAMRYYRVVGDKDSYSEAFKELRKEWTQTWFLLIPVIVGICIFVWLFLRRRALYSVRAVDNGEKSNTVGRQLLYGLHVIYHPIGGCDEIKRNRRGGGLSASLLLLITYGSMLMNQMFTGYLFNGEGEADFQPIQALVTLVIPLLLFCVSNWCLSTLMDGKGTMKDIFTVTCYSLIPFALLQTLITLLSNIMTRDEMVLYRTGMMLAVLWFLFILFCGTMSIHDYGVLKNLVTMLLTVVGMIILLFLAILFVNLIQQVVLFVKNLFLEISLRNA